MTYNERKFYEKDEKKYELKNNREFLTWFLNSIDNGFKPYKYTRMEDFEGLIDNIVKWYELKYPGYMLEQSYKASKARKIKDIADELSGKQFLYRLPNRQRWIMEPNFEDNYLQLQGQSSNYRYEYELYVDLVKGVVKESNISDFTNLYLEEVLALLKKYKSSADYSKLESVIKNYVFRVELRHRLLELSALKILYKSKCTDMSGHKNPNMGYARAKHFIEDFNEEFDLLLSSYEIDELYRQYVLDEQKSKDRVIRRLK